MKRSSLAACMISGLIGIAIAWFRFGWTTLNPINIDWLLGSHDSHIHFLGFHIYRFEKWGWPLGWINGYLAPVGTSIGLTDSIPLLAYLGKLFSPILPEYFQYFGFWLFLSMFLQGLCGYALMGFVTRCSINRVLGAIFFILSPTMLHRVSPASHIALSAHWLVLLSLWIYFDTALRKTGVATTIIRWLAWLAIAGLVHPYLACMGFAVACCSLFDLFKSEILFKRMVKSSAAAIVFSLVLLIEWVTTGLFNIPAGDFSAIGFGNFSMNVNAPVNSMQLSNIGPSFGLLTDGQYEGFNYLGLGMLILGCFALLQLFLSKGQRRILLVHLERHRALCLLCLVLTFFSIGSHIGIGSILFFKLPIPEYNTNIILGSFRSSGRFFWPVNYLLVLSIIFFLNRSLRPARATLLLLAALSVQIADLYNSPLLMQNTFSNVSYQNHLQNPGWEKAFQTFKRISAVPPFKRTLLNEDDYRDFLLLGAKYHIPVNMGFAARDSSQMYADDRKRLYETVRSGNLALDTFYVFKNPCHYLINEKRHEILCHRWDGYIVCYDAKASLDLSAPLKPNDLCR